MISSDGLSPSLETQNPKQATLDDLDHIIDLCLQFHGTSFWASVPVNSTHVRTMATNVINTGGVFFTDTGFIAGLVQGTLMNPDVLGAVELLWYAPQGGGQNLREAFEGWAKERGATIVQLTHPVTPGLSGVTERMVARGYTPFELSYVKGL